MKILRLSSNGLLHYLHFAWKLMKASAKAFTASMGACMDDIEALEAVEASMEDMEDKKASTEVTSTRGSDKVSLEASTKASMELTSTKAFTEAFMFPRNRSWK